MGDLLMGLQVGKQQHTTRENWLTYSTITYGNRCFQRYRSTNRFDAILTSFKTVIQTALVDFNVQWNLWKRTHLGLVGLNGRSATLS